MKRKTALVMCVLMIISLSVYAQGTITHIVSEDGRGFTVTYSDTENFGKATLMMLKDSELVYMTEKKLPVSANTVTFDEFKIDDDKWLSGDYVLKVGANKSITTSEPISFVNSKQMKNSFLNVINPQVSSTVQLVDDNLGRLAEFVDFKYADKYLKSGEYKNRICQSIINLNLYSNYNSDSDNTAELVSEFCEFMNRMYEAVDIMSSQNASDVVSLIDSSTAVSFDKTYFSNDTVNNPKSKYVYDRNVIGQAVVDYDFLQHNSVDVDKLIEVLNGNTLLYVINNNDYITSEDAVKHFENNTYMKMNYTSYNTLNSTKRAKVFSTMKDEKITDYTKIPLRFKTIAENLAQPGGGGLLYGSSGVSSSAATVVKTEDKNEETQPSESVTPGDTDFSDLANVSWAKEAISELKKIGAINGVDGDRYDPEAYVSREAFVKMITVAYGLTDENATSEFSDVPADSWSYPYVSSAFKIGLIEGTGEEFFDAQSYITREDAAVIIYRAYTKKVGSVEASESFTDESDISDYAKEAVSAMKKLGVINGYEDGSFGAKKNITRAECAKMIYEAYKLIK